MSSPGSALPSVLRPAAPALTGQLPAPARSRIMAELHQLPPVAVAAAGMAIVLSVGFVSGRVLAVNLSYLAYFDTTETARVLGSVSFLSIVAIVAAILLGHRGLLAIPQSRAVSRHLTTIVLGAAYLHLVLWFTRVISASVATATIQSSALFMSNVFWWG